MKGKMKGSDQKERKDEKEDMKRKKWKGRMKRNGK